MTTRKPKPPEPPQDQAEVLDAEAVAREQIQAHLGGRRVDSRRLHVALTRHTLAVRAAGGAVELDWYTRRALDPTRGQ